MMDNDLGPRMWSVSAFNRLIQHTLSSEIPLSWISGEISGFTRAASGHWYFSLKDASAQVRCVMFRTRNQFVDWQPENGVHVEVRATAGLFEARGEFQLQVDTLRRAGIGVLAERFEQLRRSLAAEGLFDAARKRPLPALPARIGVITSAHGAAVHDILTTLRRMAPMVGIILYPCQVQGAKAAADIAHAVRLAGQRGECDTLIVSRGGGSMEDLWPFNEEAVARAIAASPIPVVTGIGHETDFTIADFVADLRAPTPTAAASVACTHREQLQIALDGLQTRLDGIMHTRFTHWQQQLRWFAARLVHPGDTLRLRQQTLQQLAGSMRLQAAHLQQRQRWRLETLGQRLVRARPEMPQAALQRTAMRLVQAMRRQMMHRRDATEHMAEQLGHLNPHGVLARGYALVTDAEGVIVRDAGNLHPGSAIYLRLGLGTAEAVVSRTGSGADDPNLENQTV